MDRHMFEVYTEKVIIETRNGPKEFELLPLSGRFYGKLMTVADKLKKEGEVEEKVFEDIHMLIFETLKFSYKIEDPKELENLDRFVSQNLQQFIEPLVKVNVKQDN